MNTRTIKRVEARGQAIIAKMKAIRDAIQAEGREPTPAEVRRIDALDREMDTLLAKLR